MLPFSLYNGGRKQMNIMGNMFLALRVKQSELQIAGALARVYNAFLSK